MSMLRLRWLAFLFACVAVHAAGQDASPGVPALSARITDLTATLDANAVGALDAKLAALEQRKGAQIAVVIVPSTGSDSIEQYATRVFDAWKLGRKGVDDGVLIVVAKNDRRVRIEVGYGLEGAIPDAAAKRVAHDYMSPKFAAGDFAAGLGAGVDALAALIDEEPLPPPPTASGRPVHVVTGAWDPAWLIVGLLLGAITGAFLLLVFVQPRAYRVLLGRVPGRLRPLAIGAVNALPAGLLTRSPFAAATALLAGAGIAAVAGMTHAPSPRRSGGGSGGSSGGGSDSGSSGSSSSGGGFSGGGGSSGGGGASDSW